jgi:hypothetical protein
VHDGRDVLEVIVRVEGEERCVGFRQSNRYSTEYKYEGRPSSISEAAAVAVAADHVRRSVAHSISFPNMHRSTDFAVDDDFDIEVIDYGNQ